MLDNTLLHRVAWKLLAAIVLPACCIWGAAHAWTQARSAPAAQRSTSELPTHWDGRAIRPLALTDVEVRFARRFPGSLARMTDGEQVLVLRDVHQPTRMLHPAADCYRGTGWQVADAKLQHDARERLWRCFDAHRGGARLRVCEQIVDADGAVFTDTSAWFWSAALGNSRGPWQAVTVARPL